MCMERDIINTAFMDVVNQRTNDATKMVYGCAKIKDQ